MIKWYYLCFCIYKLKHFIFFVFLPQKCNFYIYLHRAHTKLYIWVWVQEYSALRNIMTRPNVLSPSKKCPIGRLCPGMIHEEVKYRNISQSGSQCFSNNCLNSSKDIFPSPSLSIFFNNFSCLFFGRLLKSTPRY